MDPTSVRHIDVLYQLAFTGSSSFVGPQKSPNSEFLRLADPCVCIIQEGSITCGGDVETAGIYSRSFAR